MVGGFHGMLYLSAKYFQDLLPDGKRRFGNPFDGPVFPFGVMVKYHSISAKDSRDCISSAQKSYQVFFSAKHYTRENLERRHYGRGH